MYKVRNRSNTKIGLILPLNGKNKQINLLANEEIEVSEISEQIFSLADPKKRILSIETINTSDNLEDKRKEELIEISKELGLEVDTKVTKKEIIEAIENIGG